MLVKPTVKLGTVVFDDDDDLAAEMHWVYLKKRKYGTSRSAKLFWREIWYF